MIDDLVTPEVDTTPAPRRRRLRWSFFVAGLAIAAAVAYLIYANTTTTAAYYMTVKELRGCHDCAGRIVRVAGAVQTGTITRDDRTQTVRFTIDDGQSTLPVTYSGIVPDIFRAGVTVVVRPG
jgi:cytochrome c-type biogenesis protein CcmE